MTGMQKAIVGILALLMVFVCGILVTLVGGNAPTPGPPTPTPTVNPYDVGLSRTTPAAFGEPVINEEKVECTVLAVQRGVEFSFPKPGAGMEWVVITLKLRNLGPENQTENYNALDFRVVGASSIIHDRWFTPTFGVKDLGAGEFFGGAEITGKIAQEAGIGETDLVLIWDPSWLTQARYLSLESP